MSIPVLSQIRHSAIFRLKVGYEDAGEVSLGLATNASFNLVYGQKAIYTVDSPFPQEIAQAAGPSSVRGSVTIWMPYGSDPVRLGLVPPLRQSSEKAVQAGSRYIHLRFYDRVTGELAFAINFCKVLGWGTSMQSRSVVTARLDFEGTFFETGSF